MPSRLDQLLDLEASCPDPDQREELRMIREAEMFKEIKKAPKKLKRYDIDKTRKK